MTEATESRRSTDEYPRLAVFTFLFISFVIVIAADMADGTLYLGDVDDRMRAIEINQFLGGKGWYDLTISGIALPETYVSPWSRLVDTPYALLAHFLSLVMAPQAALKIAFLVWPPVMLVGFIWFSANAM